MTMLPIGPSLVFRFLGHLMGLCSPAIINAQEIVKHFHYSYSSINRNGACADDRTMQVRVPYRLIGSQFQPYRSNAIKDGAAFSHKCRSRMVGIGVKMKLSRLRQRIQRDRSF